MRRMLGDRLPAGERGGELPGVTAFSDFRARAAGCRATGGLVPVWRDCLLDRCTPVSAFARLRRGPFAFLLELRAHARAAFAADSVGGDHR